VVVVVALSSVYAQSSVAGRLQDLDYITNQLPKLHPNFFFQLDPVQFQQASNGLRANISTLTDAQFHVGLAQLVSMAGDVQISNALCAGVLLTVRLGVWFIFGNARQHDRIAVGEFSHQRQVSAHGLNGLPQSGNHQIGAFFKLGNAVLPYAAFLGHANLSELACAPELLQRHFLGDEPGRTGRHLPAPSRA